MARDFEHFFICFLPDFKLYYKAIAIETSWCWHKNRHENQWNIIENLDMNPHIYTHLIFDKCTKNMQWRREPFQQMFLGKTEYLHAENETRSMSFTLYKYELKVD
jgi:hypothetical protein